MLFNIMKKLYSGKCIDTAFLKSGIIIFFLTLYFGDVFSQLVYEPFNYTPHATNSLATQSSSTWTAFNSGVAVYVEAGNLSYAGLQASTGNRITYSYGGEDYYRPFTSQTSGTVYASFLLNITSLGTLNTTGGYTMGFIDNSVSNFTSRFFIRNTSIGGTATYNIGINPGTVAGNLTWASANLNVGTTYFIVISQELVSGGTAAGTGNDVTRLFINPAPGLPEPVPTISSINTGATDASSIQRIFIRKDNTSQTPQTVIIDEIRVGTTWLQVTPGASNFFWNGPTTAPSGGMGPSAGGTGTWNTVVTNTNWISPTDDNVGTAVAWTNNSSNIANFTAGTGSVNLATDITAADIKISTGNNGYTFITAAPTVSATLNSPVTLSSGSILNVQPDATAPITFSAVVSGAGGLNFNGTSTGSKILSGANTYTGGTSLSDGTLFISNATALGATSSAFTISGGTIDAIPAITLSNNNAQTWGGNFTFTGSNNLNIGTGNVALTGNRLVTVNANTLTVGGIISGAGFSLTKAGAGTLTLTGNNTFTGGLINNAGTLNLSGTNNLGSGAVVNNAGTLNFSNSKTIGSIGVTGGTVNLSGTSSYTGGTSVNTGTLALGSANTLPSAGNISMTGGTLTTGGFSQAGLGTLTLGTGTSTINLANNNHSINFAASNLIGWTGTLTITGWTGTGGSSGTNGKIFFGAAFGTLTPAQRASITFTGFTGTPMLLSTGELVPFGPSTFTSVSNGDWNNASTWDQGSVPSDNDLVIIRAVDVVYTNTSLNRNASTTVNGGFELRTGGYAGGSTAFTYAATGSSLIFNTGNFYGIAVGQTFWPASNSPFNVTVNSGSGADLQASVGARTVAGTLSLAGQFNVGAAGGITVTGTLLINAGGYVSANTPIYGNSSTLVYNTTYGVGTEWTGNAAAAGSGVPQNVTIQNSATVTMPAANRGMAGNLNVNSGSLVLNVGGDFYIAGNWNRATGTGFTPSGKAVFFNGSALQTINTFGGETFNYLVLNNSNASGVRLLNNATINGSTGSTLQLINSGPFDLNGQVLNLTNNGGSVYVNGASRTITSATAATINVTGSKTVSNNSGTGTLVFGSNITIVLTNNLDFGLSGGPISTIQGTLRIDPSGAVNTNPPIYTTSSTLIYNTGSAYSNVAEWTAGATNTVAAGLGIPNNVILQTSGTNVTLAGARGLQGNLTVSNGATLTLNGGAGQDLYTKGNLIFTGTGALAANTRAIFFVNNASTQTISSAAALTIPYMVLAPASGSTIVQLLSNLIVSAPTAGNVVSFNSASDVLDINGQTLTLGTLGIANTINGTGTFKGSTTSNLSLLGAGSIGTLRFTSGSQILGNLVVNRTAGQVAAVLGTDLSLNGSSTAFTNGFLNIGANNLIFTLAAAYTGGSNNSFIQADGAGYVFKNINAVNLSFIYPIGDNLAPDGAQYGPAAMDFTGTTSFSGFAAGVKITDAVHPNVGASPDYITRYWSVTSTGSITGPVYSFTGTYTPVDIVGTETNALASRWDGSGWMYGTAIGSNTLTLTGLTDLPSTNDFSARSIIPCADLFISEYVEGSGTLNKYVEIYNPTSSPINMSNYRVAKYSNGSSTVTGTPPALTGTIAAYSTYVIGYSNAGVYGPCNFASTYYDFNGNDAIALQTTAGINIDVIGQIGVDPGIRWGTISLGTEDNSLVRNITVQTGDNNGSNAFDPATEWEGFNTNDISHLGWHLSTCNPQTTAYYRSRATGPADWNSGSSWEYSLTGIAPWNNATVPPTYRTSAITIQAGHTIFVNSSISLDQTTINGILESRTGSVFNINDGTGDDITISNGGRLNIKNNVSNNYTSFIVQNANAAINIANGGKIVILGDGTSLASNAERFGTETRNVWNHHAILEWNCPTNTMGWGGNTFFPNANSTTIPYLLISAHDAGTPGGAGTNQTIVNGLLIINTNLTVGGTANKTFRDGISGNATLTLPTTIGTVNITGASPIIGGSNLTINSDKIINIITNVSLTVPLDSVVNMGTSNSSYFDKGANSNFIVNGTANMGVFTITNTSGAVTINGTLRTAHPGGLESASGSGGGTVSSLGSVTNVNHGSTIEYNAPGNQNVTGSSVLEPDGAGGDTYHHIKFSGSGTKTLLNATAVHDSVTITGTAIVDAMTNNLGSGVGEKFIMDNGRLRLGTGSTQPNMNGLYVLTGGVVEFGATSGSQTIRGTANNSYQNVEVTGTDVSNSSGNVNLNANGTFIIKPTGILRFTSSGIVGPTGSQTFTMETGSIFRVANEYGFHGPDNSPSIPYYTAAVNLNIENIVLQSGSTIDYNRAAPLVVANQTITTTVPYQHLILSGENTKTPAAGVTLDIKGNLTKSGTSTFVHNEGTVLFSGAAAQNYTVNTGSSIMDFNNVTNNNATALNINSDAGINQKLSLLASSKLNLVDTADIILRSKLDTTAWVGIVPATAQINYPATGRFVIERYIKSVGNWNLIASPTAEAQSIFNSWQEANTYTANYGTRITGPSGTSGGPINAAGIDQYSIGYSMKWWDGENTVFKMKGNTVSTATDSLVNKHTGYFLFVRGDRAIGTGAVGAATTLRSRGKLYVGTSGAGGVTPPSISYTSLAAGDFISIANPYASPIDPSVLTTSGLKPEYHIWDPTMVGNYQVGQYRAFSATGAWIPTPTPQLPSPYAGLSSYKAIQSGQAFMMEANGTTATVGFKETDKIDGNLTFSRDPQNVVMMSTMLHSTNNYVVDGNRVAYDAGHSNTVGNEDAGKIMNSAENFGIVTQNKNLIIEGRKPIIATDTIFYRMGNLRTQNYSLSFEPRNLGGTGLIAELIDKYLNTRTPVSLSDSTYYNFAATADAGSKAADRFMLVFRAPSGPLPVTFVSIAAQRQQDRSIKVNWEVANEVNIEKYEVQRSGDGTSFTGILNNDATNSRQYTKNDLSPLAADNFYRIKAIGVAGDITYSPIVKVISEKSTALIVVAPNPVKDRVLNIRFSNHSAGDYILQLSNTLGQVVYREIIALENSMQIKNITLPTTLPGGNYHLIISYKNNSTAVYKEGIIIE